MEQTEDARSRKRWLAAIPAMVAIVPFLPMLLRGRIPVLRDHADYFVPLRWFTARALDSGTVPHWNPLNGLGEPWLSNPQTGVLYPPNWMFLVLPFEPAYVLWLALHLALLGTGIAFLARRFASPAWAALAGSAAILTGPVLSSLDVSNNLATLAWLPWVCVSAMITGTRPLLAAVSGGATLAMAFLAGEPSLAAIAAFVYVVTVAASHPARRSVTRIAAAGISAIAFCAPQLLPFILTLRGSDRSLGLGPESAFDQSLAAVDLPQFLSSAFSSGSSQQFVISLLVGPTLCVLILTGAVTFVRRSRSLALALLAVVTLLALLSFAGSWPPAATLMSTAGLDAVRHPARFIVPAFVLLAPLAAAGADTMRARRVPAIACGVVATGLLVLAVAEWQKDLLALAIDMAALAVLLAAGARRFTVTIAGALLVTALGLAGGFAFRAGSFTDLMPSAPSPVPGTRAAVQSSADPVLRASVRPPLAGYSNLLVGIAKADSPAPVVPAPLLQYFEAAIENVQPAVLSATSVSRLFSPATLPLEPAGETGWWKIDAIPLVSGWSGVSTVADDEAALRSFLTGDSSQIYAAVTLPSVEKIERAPVRAGITPRPNGWSITSESDRHLVLVIGERAADGWTVSIDGSPGQWFTVNGLVRGVVLRPGEHVVEWTYTTPGWRTGWIVSATLLLLLGAALLYEWVHARRARTHDSMR